MSTKDLTGLKKKSSSKDLKLSLHQLAATGNVAEADALFKKGKVDVNERVNTGENEQTPLHIAAYNGHFDMVYYLISKGASVLARDAQGWTPLHSAAVNSHLKICSLLLTRGADPNAVNNQNTTALHYIIRSPYSEELIEVLNLMIERGVDLECKNKYGETPLAQAASKGMTESVRFLIDHHANVNSVDIFNQTPLHKAVEHGGKQTVLLLLKNGADASHRANKGTGSPMDIARREKKLHLIPLLQEDRDLEQSTYADFQEPETEPGQPPSQPAAAPFIRDEMASIKFEDRKQFENVEIEDMILKHVQAAITKPTTSNIIPPVRTSVVQSIVGKNAEPEKVRTIADEPWYYPDLNRVEAESLLLKEAKGKSVQLVRPSSVPNSYALSQYNAQTHSFIHMLITPVPVMGPSPKSTGYKLEDCPLDTTIYPSIDTLLSKSPACNEFAPLNNPAKVPAPEPKRESVEIKQPSQKGSGIIAEISGFRIEPEKLNPPPHPRCQLNFAPCNYKNWFYHSESVEYFVGIMNRKKSDSAFEPVIVTITPADSFNYRIITWTRLGDKQIFFNCDTSKKIKWKSGLPQNLKSFIADSLREQRNDTGNLSLTLEYVSEAKDIRDKLLEFEAYDPLRAKCYSVGVVYSKEGQTDESELFSNETGSPAFNEFLNFLGDTIKLKGWKGYRGDLDVKTNTTGEKSVYRRWKGYEIMFHVSTMLPFVTGQEQQLARKRRIGNDVTTIIFQEGGQYIPPIKSQILHSYFVVSPVYTGSLQLNYKLSVTTVQGVEPFGPDIPANSTFTPDHAFRDFLFTKILNGHLASLKHPDLREKIWCRPKEHFLANLVKQHTKNKQIQNALNPE